MAQTIGHDAIGVILSCLSFCDSLHAAQTCTLWYEAMLLLDSRQETLTLKHFGLLNVWKWQACGSDALRLREITANVAPELQPHMPRWWHCHQGHHIKAIQFEDNVNFLNKSIRLDQLDNLSRHLPYLRGLDLHMSAEDISEDVWSSVTYHWKHKWQLPQHLHTLRIFFYWDTRDFDELQRVFTFVTSRIIAQCRWLEELSIVPFEDRNNRVTASFAFLHELEYLHTFTLKGKEEYDEYRLSKDNERLLQACGFKMQERIDDVDTHHPGDVYLRTQ